MGQVGAAGLPHQPDRLTGYAQRHLRIGDDILRPVRVRVIVFIAARAEALRSGRTLEQQEICHAGEAGLTSRACR